MRVLPQEDHADLGLVDHEPAGDDDSAEIRTTPVISVRQHRAGAVRTTQTAR